MTCTRLLVIVGALGTMVAACAGQEGGMGTGSGGSNESGEMSSSSGNGRSTSSSGTGGGTSTGGAPSTGSGGVTSTGGAPGTGGASGTGGQSATGGAGGTGGGGAPTGDGGAIPLKNPPVPSAGCGKPTRITSSGGYKTIMSSGDQRQYMITLPSPYDMNKPYRFIYASHGSGGEGSDITREKYYSLQTVADAAKDPAIFVAASGLGGIWGLKDVPLFDDILAFVEQNACVDTSRVFVLGFSFGGMYSYSLSMTRQKTIRAGIGMSPANYAIQIPPKTHEPIAWMQSTGMSDTTCPWVQGNSTTNGAKYIAIEHGTDNGCTVPDPIPTWKSGGMLCDDFAGCKPGYPVKVCTFNGGHGLPPGSANWMWAFITQF